MRLTLALAAISAAALAYEVLLVRLFAIVQWHHFAFMAIAIALLGFGASGTVLALLQERVRPHLHAVFTACASGFGIAAPACFLLAQALPFNALAVLWVPAQLLFLPALHLLLALPFFLAAIAIGTVFVCRTERIGQLYAADLIGAAAGALGIVAALSVLHPSDCLRLVGALGFLAAALAATRRPVAVTALLGLAAVALLPDAWLALRISPFKGLPQALAVSGTRLVNERSGPLALLSVVESPTVPFRYVPGLSLNATQPPPRQLGVFVDGGDMAAIHRFDGDISTLSYLDYTTDALPYHLLDRPRVLLLGAGGGSGVLQAIAHDARHIDAIELDANMGRLVAQDHAAAAGHIYERPDVTVHIAEARAFVTAARAEWDLIQVPLLDAFAGGAGVHGLSETYVYTVQAFARYLDRLASGGWLSITRWLKLPPRDSLRLLATAAEALRRRGADPTRHLVLLRGFNTVTLLVKRDPVTAADIARIRAFAEARSFDLAYHPGIGPDVPNRYNVLDEPYFHAGATALLGPGRDDFLARYKFDVAPTTDDRPYFFDFAKWRALPELFALGRTAGAGLLELGGPILLATLAQAAGLSAALILAPLWLRRDRLAAAPRRWRAAGYFLALGLGFLFVEIAFIQRFVLFLGHPLTAVAVVLTGFLLFAGLGSALSARIERRWRHAQPAACVAVAALALLSIAALPALFDALPPLPLPARVAIALAAIAPLALCMGLPFPLGLSRLRESSPALVPWAWGLNGCASVLSALLATLLAMQLGFTVVVLSAALLYACAAALAPRLG